MNSTTSKLLELAGKRFRVDPGTLQPEDDFFLKLKINSLDALNLLSDLEREFNIEIPDYEVADVKTFSALAEVIDRIR